ncbi:Zinc ion binding nucleic acid binding protein [Quillaja saponaria]|uniref:Zinc ion binding nucleic acid binding protein n=1 Tax=Quillaja saponaria TaxID=32244 RepID=A0AAD7LVS8_QUISA|nr:Zinc ion binding nucleic acid binding protein [Quillaja saponaria]
MDEGPWMIMGHYRTVRKWRPNFRPKMDTIKSTAVWLRLLGFPLEFYDEHILLTIVNTIGKAIKVGANTKLMTKARFAKICVELDLNKPLKPKILFNGEWLKVEYDGIQLICFSCGMQGHKDGACPLTVGRAVKDNEVNMVPVNILDGGGNIQSNGGYTST